MRNTCVQMVVIFELESGCQLQLNLGGQKDPTRVSRSPLEPDLAPNEGRNSRMAGSEVTWGRGDTRRIHRMALVLFLLRFDLVLCVCCKLDVKATTLIREEANLGWIGKRRKHADESTLQKGSLFIEAESQCGSSTK
jgi:hypothetical protein